MNDLKNKKVLVTGSDGFIGSHLVERLVEEGCHVRAFVLYNSFNSYGWLDSLPAQTLKKIEIFSGDIRDAVCVAESMKEIEYVFHLAALISIPYSYRAPKNYIETNVNGTVNVLQAAREAGIKQFIHTSTSEVYGTARYVPIDEKHPLQPQSPYSASKISADQFALSYFYTFELPVSIVRPFNTFGPRQSARAVIPAIISQLAANKSEINLGLLTPTRDFVFVEDTVSGFVAAARSENSVGKAINLGTNYEITIGDLFNLIKNLMDKNTVLKTQEERIRPKNSEVERLWADNSQARKYLDWQPHYFGEAGLKKALLKTIDWFTQPENLKKYKTDVYNI